MIERVLVAVDDSAESLAAARLAVRLAVAWGACLRAVTVVTDGRVTAQLRSDGAVDVVRRRAQAADAVLAAVVALGREHGVAVRTDRLEGEPARRILALAHDWPADLVVVGRSRRASVVGAPYVGSQAQHVLELSELPVLVVPPAGRRSGAHPSAVS